MSEAIIAAIITGGLSLLGVYIANRKSAAIIEYRLKELEAKQDKHNQLIERTYKLEDRANILDEKMKVVNHRIEDLSAVNGRCR